MQIISIILYYYINTVYYYIYWITDTVLYYIVNARKPNFIVYNIIYYIPYKDIKKHITLHAVLKLGLITNKLNNVLI